ncbi:MAG TPA: hypothetical protein VGC54_03740 [Planctomycetota bacterium]
MRFSRPLFALFLAAAPAAWSAAPLAGQAPLVRDAENGEVRLHVELRPTAPRLSDPVELRVEIEAPERLELAPLEFGERLGDFEIRAVREEPSTLQDGRLIVRRTLTLEPRHAGTLELPPLAIGWREQDGKVGFVETAALLVEIASEAPPGADFDALHGAAEPLDPAPAAPPWRPIGAGAVALALLVLAIRALRRRGPALAAAPPPPPTATPRQRARAGLDALQQARPAPGGDLVPFIARLTGVVRIFVEEGCGVRAPEQTTEEFLQAIAVHPDFDGKQRQLLSGLLEIGDLVKFAAAAPGVEALDASLANARRFVDGFGGPESAADRPSYPLELAA